MSDQVGTSQQARPLLQLTSHMQQPHSNGHIPTPRTHDTSLTNFHVREFGQFVERLQTAADAAFPNAGTLPYSEVHALFLFWEDDPLGCKGEVTDLHKVFTSQYNYASEMWPIPSDDSHNQLQEKVTNFKATHNKPDALLIVYYGGHGHSTSTGGSIWLCHPGIDVDGVAEGPSVDWYDIQGTLERALPDVLLLLDCCHAASANPYHASSARKASARAGTTELISACGWESWTPVVCPDSFTRAVIHELQRFGGRQFSVAQLHARVLSHLKNRGHKSTKTPVHVLLTDESRRGICLAPMPFPSATAQGQVRGEMHTSGSPGPGGQLLMDETSPHPTNVNPQVLMSFSLDDDQVLNIDTWGEWTRQIPALVDRAKIHAVYDSYSTLVLFSVPVAVWDLLPPDPAYVVIGFIRSPNRLSRSDMRSAEPVWMRSGTDPWDDDMLTTGPTLPSYFTSGSSEVVRPMTGETKQSLAETLRTRRSKLGTAMSMLGTARSVHRSKSEGAHPLLQDLMPEKLSPTDSTRSPWRQRKNPRTERASGERLVREMHEEIDSVGAWAEALTSPRLPGVSADEHDGRDEQSDENLRKTQQ